MFQTALLLVLCLGAVTAVEGSCVVQTITGQQLTSQSRPAFKLKHNTSLTLGMTSAIDLQNSNRLRAAQHTSLTSPMSTSPLPGMCPAQEDHTGLLVRRSSSTETLLPCTRPRPSLLSPGTASANAILPLGELPSSTSAHGLCYVHYRQPADGSEVTNPAADTSRVSDGHQYSPTSDLHMLLAAHTSRTSTVAHPYEGVPFHLQAGYLSRDHRCQILPTPRLAAPEYPSAPILPWALLLIIMHKTYSRLSERILLYATATPISCMSHHSRRSIVRLRTNRRLQASHLTPWQSGMVWGIWGSPFRLKRYPVKHAQTVFAPSLPSRGATADAADPQQTSRQHEHSKARTHAQAYTHAHNNLSMQAQGRDDATQPTNTQACVYNSSYAHALARGYARQFSGPGHSQIQHIPARQIWGGGRKRKHEHAWLCNSEIDGLIDKSHMNEHHLLRIHHGIYNSESDSEEQCLTSISRVCSDSTHRRSNAYKYRSSMSNMSAIVMSLVQNLNIQFFQPLNYGGLHWYCFALHSTQRTCYLLDPLLDGRYANRMAAALHALFQRLELQDWSIAYLPVKLQDDGYNCGIWAVWLSEQWQRFHMQDTETNFAEWVRAQHSLLPGVILSRGDWLRGLYLQSINQWRCTSHERTKHKDNPSACKAGFKATKPCLPLM